MTTVIKTKKSVRAKSLSSVITQSFAQHRKSSNGRVLEIACTPTAFVEHGDKWTDLAKSRVMDIAKSRGLTVASWEETNKQGRIGLKVYFAEALSSFYKDFQADLYHDLIDPEYKGNFDVDSVQCKGDEKGGTLFIELDINTYDYATSRAELQRVLKNLFADTYHKRISGMGKMKSDKPDHVVLTVTYKDVPYNG